MHYEARDGIDKFYLRDFKFMPLPNDKINVLYEDRSKKRKNKKKSTPKGEKSANLMKEWN